MRLSIPAGEVCAGDRLIVPDGEGGEREVEVPDGFPYQSGAISSVWWVALGFPRHRDELVVVERPDPPITITVQLNGEEADACTAFWYDESASPSSSAAAKVKAAIVAARAGETTP